MRILIPLTISLAMVACAQNNPSPEAAAATETTVAVTDKRVEVLDSSYSMEYLMGQFDPAEHAAFVQVDEAFANRPGMYLRKETYEAFQAMHKAALADGINLRIVSATRNFYSQKSIWEGKWTGQRKIENGKDASQVYPEPKQRALKILEYSSMPGSSRHHWGTDIDLNQLTNAWFERGEGKKIYAWLTENAVSYGFCQPYSAGRPYGYNEERWHWSYMPLSRPLTAFAEHFMRDTMISGFKGAEVASEIGVVEKYVLGINPACRAD